MLGLAIFIILSNHRMQSKIDEISKGVKTSADLKTTIDSIINLNKEIGSIASESRKISLIDKGLTELKNLFIMPSQAGIAGQTILDKTLSDIIGSEFFQPQYQLSAGRVDYMLKFKECLIPIDSKLSVENFKKMLASTDQSQKRAFWKSFVTDVKKRIDETSKYISPSEKTVDFAFMYIPSEAVYYEAFVRGSQFGEENNLLEYSMKKRVFPVSPQTIVPFLNTIVIGLKALRIEEAADKICGKIIALHNEFEKFKSIYSTVRTHIQDASNRLGDGSEKIGVIERHITSLEIEPDK